MERRIIEKLTELKQYAEFLSESERALFIAKVEAIESHYNKEFCVAVIGNFNSGKSTFLNAILNMDILPTGILPTTAIPTYIRWNRGEVLTERRKLGRLRMPEEDSPCIQVMMSDGSKLFVDGLDDYDLRIFENVIDIKLPYDISGKIEFLTSNMDLIPNIQSVHLSFPEREEFRNFCFIDTPITPQTEDDYNTVRSLNIKSNLYKNADFVFFLDTAIMPMTASSQDFIMKNFSYLKGRTVFFLTFWDCLRINIQQHFLDRIKGVLGEFLQQQEPILFPISAYMARNYQSGEDISSKCLEYSEAFDTAINETMMILREQRLSNIIGSIKELAEEFNIEEKEVNRHMAQQENKIITEGIATLRRLAEFLPESERGDFWEKLKAIESRYNDKDFYLAVIGNFNAGKSTFLNAILNMDILSTGMLPTTAIPTYIRWNRSEVLAERRKLGRLRMPEKDSPCIQVMMSDGSKLFVDGLDDYDLRVFENATGIVLPSEVGQKIDCLTTTNDLASQVKNIYLSFPEREDFKNFCLIDTPGINPQTEDDSNTVHILNTQSVLREKADCAMLLYQGREVMSWNTKDFLSKNAAHLAGNAIVFLTYWDIIPQKDRQKILDYTTERLRDDFGQKEPIVFPISSSMARDYQSGVDKSQDCRVYSESFTAAVNNVMEMLRVRRAGIVTEKLLKLIGGLTKKLQEAVESSKKNLERQAEALQKNSWQSVQDDVSILQNEFWEKLESQLPGWESSVKSRTAMRLNSACDDVCVRVGSASDRKSLNTYSTDYYKTAVTNAQNCAWEDIIGIVFSDIEKEQKKFRDEVERCLHEHGRYLGGTDILRDGGLVPMSSSKSASLPAVPEQLSAVGDWIGRTVGLVLFGPLGFFGGWVIDAFRFDSRKKEIKDKIRKGTEKFITDLSQDFMAIVQHVVHNAIDWSENILDNYMDKYSALYAQAEKNYEQNKANNAMELERRASVLGELENLNKLVTEWRAEEWTNSTKYSQLKNRLANAFRNSFRLMLKRP